MDAVSLLKWDGHISTLVHGVSNFRDKELFTDATIACEDKFFHVHRLVLSMYSSYFCEIFNQTPCHSPVVILRGVKHQEMEVLLNYMYQGKAEVCQKDLGSVIKSAEFLQIKGFIQVRNNSDSTPETEAHDSELDNEPPSKRQKNSNPTTNQCPEDEELPNFDEFDEESQPADEQELEHLRSIKTEVVELEDDGFLNSLDDSEIDNATPAAESSQIGSTNSSSFYGKGTLPISSLCTLQQSTSLNGAPIKRYQVGSKVNFVVGDWIYQRKWHKDNILYLWCQRGKCPSTARLTLKEGGYENFRLIRPHNHPHNLVKIHDIALEWHFFHEMENKGSRSPSDIYKALVETYNLSSLTLEQLKLSRRKRIKKRKGMLPENLLEVLAQEEKEL